MLNHLKDYLFHKSFEKCVNMTNKSLKNNQLILLNPSNLQNQQKQRTEKSQSENKNQLAIEENDKNGAMAEDPMTLSDYLNAISKTFTERKLIQKVLPTKFSREFLSTNIQESTPAICHEDSGSYSVN